jgi:hypothetical protein
VVPEFETTVPSTKQTIRFRPFLVKEEKILYMALESNELSSIIDSLKSILQTCILTEDIDVNKFAAFDLEWMFLQIRAKSVGEVFELSLKHNTPEEIDASDEENKLCDGETQITINVDDIKIDMPEDKSPNVQINDQIGVVLRYPTVDALQNSSADMTTSQAFDLIGECVVSVYDVDNVYDNFSKKEVEQFLESLSQEQFQKITSYFNDMPMLRHEVKWTCEKCGEDQSMKLEGLQTFFI